MLIYGKNSIMMYLTQKGKVMTNEQKISTWLERIKAIRLKKIDISRDTNISYGCILNAFSGKQIPRSDTVDKIDAYITSREAENEQ